MNYANISIQKADVNKEAYVPERILERGAFAHEQPAKDIVPLVSGAPLDDLHSQKSSTSAGTSEEHRGYTLVQDMGLL